MPTLYAQPYDTSAIGFYFDSEADYLAKSAGLRNAYGQLVEEFEIQFIQGEGLDCHLFGALGIHQGSVGGYFDAVEIWSADDKIRVIIAIGEAGYSFDLGSDSPDKFEVDLYACESLRDLAIQFVDDGLFGDIPDSIQNYLDYDSMARDLSIDYGQVTIDGAPYIYRCA
ncbi:antirestriction protein ArdA [Asticcacaulis sp. EMRT-3]|uniref:antirestriction protein ArdA n=1 Tax=Asticcacaulis sp. EMRT-3 TaxID=3040349 RepID=UPI0024AF8818|nr:antirestriction protein ArdA [Asticcacaulis sp. EMRT-3]MDI7774702.1 antirestriction protein ArdA [Asticcacaulis sp. EMRT-3]